MLELRETILMLDAFLEPDKYPRVTTRIETLRGGGVQKAVEEAQNA